MTETRQKKIKIELFKEQETYTIYNGSMLDMLQVIEPNSIDAIVTDPPYHLKSITERFGKENSAPAKYGEDGSFSRLSKGFMNQTWDGGDIAFRPETWRKCYEALKPGGYLLAFGGSRTFHRTAVAIEDAGFEIRDTIMWIYGSGFPKSMNIGLAIDKKLGVQGQRGVGGFNVGGKQEQTNRKAKLHIGSTTDGSKQKTYTDYKSDLAKQWQGWGTALKPAYEPIIVARKPFKGSLVENVLNYGVGGLNIDDCRVGDEYFKIEDSEYDNNKNQSCFGNVKRTPKEYYGRFPANVIHDGSEEVVSLFPHTKSGVAIREKSSGETFGGQGHKRPPMENLGYDDGGGSASRFFYVAKASKKDRDEGLDLANPQKVNDGRNKPIDNPFLRAEKERKNIHPTVKPCELMQYLVRLVAPKGATILDPFMGSGSTGKAVMFENRERNANYKFIGVDLEQKYCEIANARIDYALNKYEYDVIKEQQQSKQRGQASIFDFIEVK